MENAEGKWRLQIEELLVSGSLSAQAQIDRHAQVSLT